jgi:hypothetical protein
MGNPRSKRLDLRCLRCSVFAYLLLVLLLYLAHFTAILVDFTPSPNQFQSFQDCKNHPHLY